MNCQNYITSHLENYGWHRPQTLTNPSFQKLTQLSKMMSLRKHSNQLSQTPKLK
ncbi:hypothetical protein TcasGA2_TC034799 [Tribolium castaneum]|uniref:Uncharacterized protein n=1 Tax=Tribolium castaneum TaxID=7070 RepID=A0A139WEG2_TRICA|nr:hypothetical protein TcasGA2_TC034799 [Tribolium castaneum]